MGQALMRRVVFCGVVFAAVSAPALAFAADGNQKGTTVADSGFRPKPNGFGFENWGGDQYPASDLTADDAALLFGPRVCARMRGDSCEPTPAAKLWLAEMNQMMKGGHCEGMAALSAAFHVNAEKVADYGSKQAFELQPKGAELLRTISSYFATQALEPVNTVTSETRGWPLQKIVDFIAATLSKKDDYATLGIYGSNGGHAVTPYMVELRSAGLYRIYVYDNNYPGAEKYIDIDVPRDRWVYAGAALNPKEDPEPWEGGSGSMDVTLLSSRYEPLKCPFCGGHQPPANAPAAPSSQRRPRKPSTAGDGYSVFTPSRCSQVQATRQSDKKKLTGGKSGAKAEIGGASMRPLRGARGCFVRLPQGSGYDIALIDDGRPNSGGSSGLIIFTPGNVYSVSNIALSQGTTQGFTFNQDAFSYQAGGSQQPTLRIAGDRAGTNTLYEVSGFTLSDGRTFNAAEDSEGRVAFSDDDPSTDSYDISAEVVSESETEVHDVDDVDVGDDGALVLDGEDDGGLDVDVDSDNDGQVDDVDTDDDNDGALDSADTDDDNDGTLDDKEVADSDHDGSEDAVDTDDDNDGTLDAADSDDDNDGVADVNESDGEDEAAADADHDGTADSADTDDDNDGTPDVSDSDDDNDGVADSDESDGGDEAANDADHDGTDDAVDADDDNDGTPDVSDSDDDNDGVADADESADDSVDGDDGEADAAADGADDSDGGTEDAEADSADGGGDEPAADDSADEGGADDSGDGGADSADDEG